MFRTADVPDIIYSDEQRLMQVLRNLLSSAFKFTADGEITLTISQLAGDELKHILPQWCHTAVIAFEVRDTGIGIDPGKLEVIFEAFRQADGTTSRKFGGTGLGLSISREMALLMKGRICVESTPGVGSIFTFYVPSLSYVESGMILAREEFEERRLPVAAGFSEESAAIESDEEPMPASLSSSSLAGKRILVVDDDIRNVYSLTIALEKEGVEVLTANNGEEALQLMKSRMDIDLVLMDIMMPVMDGYEAMRQIRQHPEYHSVPVIALTAKAMMQDRELCIKAGASDYISKPLNTPQLYSLLEVWLQKKTVLS